MGFTDLQFLKGPVRLCTSADWPSVVAEDRKHLPREISGRVENGFQRRRFFVGSEFGDGLDEFSGHVFGEIQEVRAEVDASLLVWSCVAVVEIHQVLVEAGYFLLSFYQHFSVFVQDLHVFSLSLQDFVEKAFTFDVESVELSLMQLSLLL